LNIEYRARSDEGKEGIELGKDSTTFNTRTAISRSIWDYRG